MRLRRTMLRAIQIMLFIVYLYLLVKLILFKLGPVSLSYLLNQLENTLHYPEQILNRPSNYIPFKQITRDMNHMALSDPYSFSNLWGNIVAFIPLGLFLPVILKLKRFGFFKVLLLSFFLSLSFETTQLLLYIGTFDVDDLILNTAGALMGYVGWAMLRMLVKSTGNKVNRLSPTFGGAARFIPRNIEKG